LTRSARLAPTDALALVLGPGRPPAARLLADRLTDRPAARERLPWPLYVWGFDSI